MSETGAPRIFPSPTRGSGLFFVGVICVLLLAWLPAFVTLPPLDRDESRFAEASRQMVETGNYIDIRFASGPRYNKPIGIYWLQSLSAIVAGPNLRSRIWVYRVPSLLGGLLSTLFMYCLARAVASRETALVAAALLGTTVLLGAESSIATTDAALLAATVAAQGVLMRVYLGARGAAAQPGTPLVMLGWVAVAIGMLLKGPVILGVLAVTAAALSVCDRDFSWLRETRPLRGAMLALALVLPWALAIGFATHGAFYRQSLGQDFASKLLAARELHGAPPGYYLLETIITFWPATLALIPALASAIARRREPLMRFLLAWSGGVWILFELVPTKLPHYILPAYPALAFVCAMWVAQENGMDERRRERGLRAAGAGLFVIGVAALAAGCVFLPIRFGGLLGPLVMVGVVVASALACAAAIFLVRSHRHGAIAFAVASAVMFDVLLGLFVVPQLPDLWLSPRASQLVVANRRATDPAPILTGYVEPSMIFLLGAETQITGPRQAATAARHGGVVLVESRANREFLAGVAASGSAARALGTVTGLDYSIGRKEQITLYRVSPAPH